MKKINYSILLLFLFFTTTAFIHIFLNKTPAPSDSCYYLVSASGLAYTDNLSQYLKFILSYPVTPLLIALPSLLFKIAGISLLNAISVMTIIYMLIIVTMYKCLMLFKDKTAAITGAIIVGCVPIIFGMSRTFMPDAVLTFFILLSFLFLIKSNNFTNLASSLLFGLCSALGMMSKATFPVFIIMPVIFNIKKKSFPFVIYSMIVTLCLTIPWYVQNFTASWIHYSETKNTVIDFSTIINNIASPDRMLIYLKTTVLEIFSLPHFILFLLSVFVLYVKNKKLLIRHIIYILFPLVFILALSETILPRYLMPINIFSCIIIALAAKNIKTHMFLRTIYIAIYLSLSFLPSFDYLFLKNIFPYQHTKQNPHTAILYGNFGLNTKKIIPQEVTFFLKEENPKCIYFLSNETSDASSIIENIFLTFSLEKNILFKREGDLITKNKKVLPFSFSKKDFTDDKNNEIIILLKGNQSYGVSLKEFNESAGLSNINKEKIKAVDFFISNQENYTKKMTFYLYDKTVEIYQRKFHDEMKTK